MEHFQDFSLNIDRCGRIAIAESSIEILWNIYRKYMEEKVYMYMVCLQGSNILSLSNGIDIRALLLICWMRHTKCLPCDTVLPYTFVLLGSFCYTYKIVYMLHINVIWILDQYDGLRNSKLIPQTYVTQINSTCLHLKKCKGSLWWRLGSLTAIT